MKLVSLKKSLFEKFELNDLSKILGGATGSQEDSSGADKTKEDVCHVEDDDAKVCYWSTNAKDGCIT